VGQFIIVGLLGLLSGILFAPKKGCELRDSIRERGESLWDKLFCTLARTMEPARPRSESQMNEPVVMGEVTDESELAATEALERIKAALDHQKLAS